MDNQVKIRGNRIELGEIERVMDAHESVNKAIVLAKEAASGAQLVAYVLPNNGYSEGEVRSAASTQLPGVYDPFELCCY